MAMWGCVSRRPPLSPRVLIAEVSSVDHHSHDWILLDNPLADLDADQLKHRND